MGQNRHLGDARYKHLLALIAQASGEGAPFQVASTFVFRPGGVAYRNVFATWEALMDAVEALDPDTPKIIVLDASLATAHATARATPWKLNVTLLTSAGQQSSAARTLVLDDGCHFACDYLMVDGALQILQQGTTPCITWTTADGLLDVRSGEIGSAAPGTAPFVELASGGLHIYLRAHAQLGQDTNTIAAFKVDAGAPLTVRAFDTSQIQASVFTGGGTVAVDAESGTTVSLSQPGLATFTVTFKDVASQVSYTADPTKWVGTPPATVGQAIDRIAANTANAHPIP